MFPGVLPDVKVSRWAAIRPRSLERVRSHLTITLAPPRRLARRPQAKTIALLPVGPERLDEVQIVFS